MQSINVENAQQKKSNAVQLDSTLCDFCIWTAKVFSNYHEFGKVIQPQCLHEYEDTGKASFYLLSRVNEGSSCNNQAWTVVLCHNYVLSLVCLN